MVSVFCYFLKVENWKVILVLKFQKEVKVENKIAMMNRKKCTIWIVIRVDNGMVSLTIYIVFTTSHNYNHTLATTLIITILITD